MIIVQDSREKTPWNFVSSTYCKGQVIQTLPEGDYTIDGYSNLICIERKKTVNELATNLSKKYPQFKNEMERLTKYRFRYVICEFSEQKLIIYPKGSGLPKSILKRIRIGGKFLHKRVMEIQDEYGIEFCFCEDKYEAIETAMKLLLKAQSIYDEENRPGHYF